MIRWHHQPVGCQLAHHHRTRARPGLQHLVLDADAGAHRCDRYPGDRGPRDVRHVGRELDIGCLASARIRAAGLRPAITNRAVGHRGKDTWPDRFDRKHHGLDVGLIVQRSGEAQCRLVGFRRERARLAECPRRSARHAPCRGRRSGAASARLPRRRTRWQRAAHRAAGEARRDSDLAQRPIALAQIAVGQEAAPELQRIAVDHIHHRGRQIAAPEPQCFCASPDQRAIGTVLAHRAVQRGAKLGLVETPRIGEPPPRSVTGTWRAIVAGMASDGGAISVIDQRVGQLIQQMRTRSE